MLGTEKPHQNFGKTEKPHKNRLEPQNRKPLTRTPLPTPWYIQVVHRIERRSIIPLSPPAVPAVMLHFLIYYLSKSKNMGIFRNFHGFFGISRDFLGFLGIFVGNHIFVGDFFASP